MRLRFYIDVFNSPTLKDFFGHHKLWNEVMFWFTQMMCYNVYIPLLIRPEIQDNEIYALFDKHHKESYSSFSILAFK